MYTRNPSFALLIDITSIPKFESAWCFLSIGLKCQTNLPCGNVRVTASYQEKNAFTCQIPVIFALEIRFHTWIITERHPRIALMLHNIFGKQKQAFRGKHLRCVVGLVHQWKGHTSGDKKCSWLTQSYPPSIPHAPCWRSGSQRVATRNTHIIQRLIMVR